MNFFKVIKKEESLDFKLLHDKLIVFNHFKCDKILTKYSGQISFR